MSYEETAPIEALEESARCSIVEAQLRRRLGVSELATCAPDKRLDVIYDPGLDLVWGQ